MSEPGDARPKLFPSQGRQAVFVSYMFMFVAQGMLVTGSRHGAATCHCHCGPPDGGAEAGDDQSAILRPHHIFHVYHVYADQAPLDWDWRH